MTLLSSVNSHTHSHVHPGWESSHPDTGAAGEDIELGERAAVGGLVGADGVQGHRGQSSSVKNSMGARATSIKAAPWYVRFGRRIGRGIYHDIRARAPYYASDWTDAWNYRVVPATWVSERA